MDWTKAFAASDTTKLHLDPGKLFWIVVRDELSHAENRAIQLGAFRRVYRGDEQLVELDQRAGADQKVLTYLVDWNLLDASGKTIDISSADAKRDAVKNLTPAHYMAIEALIDEHVLAVAKKKVTSGTPASSVTSGSPAGSGSAG